MVSVCVKFLAGSVYYYTYAYVNNKMLQYAVTYHNDIKKCKSTCLTHDLRGPMLFITMLEGIIQFILFFIFADNGRSYLRAEKRINYNVKHKIKYHQIKKECNNVCTWNYGSIEDNKFIIKNALFLLDILYLYSHYYYIKTLIY